jgi:hypothetical protein
MSCVCKRLGRVVDSFSLEKVGWRCAAHVYSSCASCGFLHYIHQFFFPHSWGAFCENVDARLWTLGTAALACYIPLRTRAHSSFPFFPAFVPLTSPPHPYLTNTVSFISSQTKFHDQSNHSPIPHSIPYSLLYFYPHPRPESPLVLPSQLFFCLYCWVVRPAPLLSSWGQPFSTLLHDFAPPPSRFSGNFTHTQFPPISSSPHTFPALPISKRQTKRNPLSRRRVWASQWCGGHGSCITTSAPRATLGDAVVRSFCTVLFPFPSSSPSFTPVDHHDHDPRVTLFLL